MLQRSKTLASASLALLSLCSLAVHASAQQRESVDLRASAYVPPTNLFGAPVRTSNQKPIEYGEADWHNQERRWLLAGGTIHRGPAGGCESFGAKSSWKWFDIGTGIGSSGFAVSESLDGPELIVSGGGFGFGGSRYWQILKHRPAQGDYVQQFTSPVYDPGLRWLTAGDFDNDNDPEILVVLDGWLEIWDQNHRVLQSSFPILSGANKALLRDLDQDGQLDLVVCSAVETRAYNAQGQAFWIHGSGGSDLTVGQMDADPSLEVALTSGAIVDVDSNTVQWNANQGSAAYLECGDIDGDGMDELITLPTWGDCWAYDVDTELPKWTLNIFNIGASDLVDVDGDDQLELIIGEAQWGGMLIYDASTRTLEGTINNPDHGTTEVIAADADNDGMLEVIWGAGHSSTGEDRMYVGDWSTLQHEWFSFDLDGPFRGPIMADMTGDGVEEILTVSNESDSGYGAGRILIFDSETLELLAISQEVADGLAWTGTHEILPVQLDADPAMELIVATSRTYDGRFEAYDFDGLVTFTRLWFTQSGTISDGAVLDVAAGDLDDDGSMEVVGGFSDSGVVQILDATTGTVEWTAPIALPGGVREVEVGDVDGEPGLEVIALGGNGSLFIFDGATQAVEGLISGSASTFELVDPGLGAEMIRVGTSSGDLLNLRYDGQDFVQLSSVSLVNEALQSLVIRNGQVAFAGVGSTLRMFEASTGAEIWASCSEYGNTFGRGVAFGGTYIMTAGAYGLVMFERHQ